MKRSTFVILVLIASILGANLLRAQSDATRRVTLYVKPFDGSDAALAKSIRSRLIDSLTQHGVQVVESDEYADTILSGYGLAETTGCQKVTIGHNPNRCIHAIMRLVNKQGITLWKTDVASNRYTLDLASSFIDNLTRKTTDTLAEEQKRINSEPQAQMNTGAK